MTEYRWRDCDGALRRYRLMMLCDEQPPPK